MANSGTEITQSCRQLTQTPQECIGTCLEKSVPTQRAENKPLLHRGVAFHQIFSDSRFVFKLTTTCETLRKYKFYNEGDANVVEETVTYRRVHQGDPRILELSKMEHCLKQGHIELFKGIQYDIYALFEGGNYQNSKHRRTGIRGYRLVPRKGSIPQPVTSLHTNDGLYFVYEKKR